MTNEPLEVIGDIEFLYEIDLARKTLKCWQHDGSKKGAAVDLTPYLSEHKASA